MSCRGSVVRAAWANMIEWLQFVYAICTTDAAPANWRELAIATNMAVAIAYFWIPLVMAVVFWRWRAEIPFPWLWLAFATFIVACGISHIVHALHALTDTTPFNWPKLVVLMATAGISLVTAAAFTLILPRIMRYTSPAAARQRLEVAVGEATAQLQFALAQEKVLLREVHHRVKNNLQVIASLINLQSRRLPPEAGAAMSNLRERIIAMADVYDHLRENAAALHAAGFARSLGSRLRRDSHAEHVAFTVEGDDFEVSLDHAASLALILNEALSAAFRRAARVHGSGAVTVIIRDTPAGRWIAVEDNGATEVGVDAVEFAVVSALSRQLDAVPTTLHDPSGHTTFRLEFAPGTSPSSVESDPAAAISA